MKLKCTAIRCGNMAAWLALLCGALFIWSATSGSAVGWAADSPPAAIKSSATQKAATTPMELVPGGPPGATVPSGDGFDPATKYRIEGCPYPPTMKDAPVWKPNKAAPASQAQVQPQTMGKKAAGKKKEPVREPMPPELLKKVMAEVDKSQGETSPQPAGKQTVIEPKELQK